MKRFLWLFILITFCNIVVYAHYVEREPYKITQPDGVEINCFITGDEFYRRLYDENGFTITLNRESGYFVYAILVNDELLTTPYIVGETDPAQVGLTPNADISVAKKQAIRDNRLRMAPERGKPKATPGPRTGTMTNVVIYISFPDANFTHSRSSIENLFISEARGASLYSYYRDISAGNFHFNSEFFPVAQDSVFLSYIAPNPRDYYETDNDYPGEGSRREWELLYDAVMYCRNTIETTLTASQLDVNDDGDVDNIIFVVQGAPGAWSSLLWPHQWSLYNYGNYAMLHDKYVWTYNLIIENHLFTASNGQQSVLVHEAYHTLGAPDLYRYNNTDITPVGSWDVMASNTLPPQSSGSHITHKYGYFIEEIPTILTSGIYTIYDIWNRTPGENICYKLLSPKSTDGEYYVLDYRKSTGEVYESMLYRDGIIIERIYPAMNGNTNGPPDEVYVFRKGASNNQTNGEYYSAASVFYSAELDRTEFNATTNPPCFLSDNTIDAVSISRIGSAGGAYMTFYVDIGIYPEFSLSNTAPTTGESISFNNTTTTVNQNKSTFYRWDFGDGTTSTQTHPSHTYLLEGKYTITLTAETEWGYMAVTDTVVVTSSSGAPLLPFEDNFDEYTAGLPLIGQGKAPWRTWTYPAESYQNPMVTNAQAATMPNAVLIQNSNDLFFPFNNLTEGRYIIEFDYYIPLSGNGAYFNLQHYNTPGIQWASEVYFYNNGTGYLRVGGNTINFTCQVDQWFHIFMDIDLYADHIELEIDGNTVYSGIFHYQSNSAAGVNQLGGINFYAGSAIFNPENTQTLPGTYYLDNFKTFAVDEGECSPKIITSVVQKRSDMRITWRNASQQPDISISQGGNYSRTGVGAGTSSFSVMHRFTPDMLTELHGEELKQVVFAPQSTLSHSYVIKIYKGGSGSPFFPGTLIMEQSLNNANLISNQENTVTLTHPVIIDASQELWIGYDCVNLGPSGYPAGVDNLLRNEGFGNIIYLNGVWTTLYTLNSELNYNWCIKGIVQRGTDAVNIYCNGNQIVSDFIGNSYLHSNITEPEVCYTVKKLCTNGDTVVSNEVCTAYTCAIAQTLPFIEDFEGIEFPPDCWTVTNIDGGNQQWQKNPSVYNLTNVYERSASVAGHSYHSTLNQEGWLITPKISIPDSGNCILTFWSLNAYPTYYEYNGVYVSNATDINTFTEIKVLQGDEVSVLWKKISVSLSSYAGQEIYIGFKYAGLDADAWYIDDIAVIDSANYVDLEVVSVTAPVSGINLDNEDIKVVIRNNSGREIANFDLEMVIDGVSSNASIRDTIADGEEWEYTFTANLASVNTYSISVGVIAVHDCLPANNRKNVTVTHHYVSETCDAITDFPVMQDFSNNSYLCWKLISNNAINGYNGGSTLHMGTYYFTNDPLQDRFFAFSSMNYANDYNQYLISPLLPESDSLMLSFDYRIYQSSVPHMFRVGYSTTTSNISAFTWSEAYEVTSPNFIPFETRFAVENIKYIAIHYNNSNYGSAFLIDNVNIDKFRANAAAVTAITPAGGIYTDLTNAETVTATVKNMGTNAITGMNIGLTVNDNPEIIETISDINIASGNSFTYSFDAKADLSNAETYSITVRVILPDDQNNFNNTKTVIINNIVCTVTELPLVQDFQDQTWRCWNMISNNEINGPNSSGSRYMSATWRYNNYPENLFFGLSSYEYVAGEDPERYYQYLISPELPVSQNNLKLTFDYAQGNTSYYENFRIGYSTTGNDISEFTWGSVHTVNINEFTPFENDIPIPAGTKYVAVHYCNMEKADLLFIDNIAVTEIFTFNGCGGSGTENDPYQICDAQTLAALADFVNDGHGDQTIGKYYILTDSIDLRDRKSVV
jgi:M6 family metalloprotease-like protein